MNSEGEEVLQEMMCRGLILTGPLAMLTGLVMEGTMGEEFLYTHRAIAAVRDSNVQSGMTNTDAINAGKFVLRNIDSWHHA